MAKQPVLLIPLQGADGQPRPNEMIHYLAIVEFPDGEHLLHGWTENLATAVKHLDGHVLNRRRGMIPEEEVRLVSVRHLHPAKIDEEVEAEEERIRAKYPDRLHAGDIFAVPNHILERRVTEGQEEPVDQPA